MGNIISFFSKSPSNEKLLMDALSTGTWPETWLNNVRLSEREVQACFDNIKTKNPAHWLDRLIFNRNTNVLTWLWPKLLDEQQQIILTGCINGNFHELIRQGSTENFNFFFGKLTKDQKIKFYETRDLSIAISACSKEFIETEIENIRNDAGEEVLNDRLRYNDNSLLTLAPVGGSKDVIDYVVNLYIQQGVPVTESQYQNMLFSAMFSANTSDSSQVYEHVYSIIPDQYKSSCLCQRDHNLLKSVLRNEKLDHNKIEFLWNSASEDAQSDMTVHIGNSNHHNYLQQHLGIGLAEDSPISPA